MLRLLNTIFISLPQIQYIIRLRVRKSKISMQEKSKMQLLEQRLERIKKNSQILLKKMDDKITSIQQVKDDLDGKSKRMTDWTNSFQTLITSMGEKVFANPVTTLNSNFTPKKQTLQVVSGLVLKSKRICILTGAGVSKNSGIPTFRDKDGLYHNKIPLKITETEQVLYDPDQFLTIKTFQKYPEQIWNWCKSIQRLVQEKQPGVQHKIINMLCLQLKKVGSQISLITTNIDSLHYKVHKDNGSLNYDLHQIHGHFRTFLCLACRKEYPSTTDIQNFKCVSCEFGIIRPYIMFFDEVYDELFDKGNIRNKEYDLTIVVGTSLQTGLSVKIVNMSKTVIEINPKCVIKTGQVYQYEQQCKQVLAELLTYIKLKIGKRKE